MCINVHSEPEREHINLFQIWHAYLYLETRKKFHKDKLRKSNLILCLGSGKRGDKTEEQSKDWSSVFRRGDYRNKSQNPQKMSWVRVLIEVMSTVRKVRTTGPRPKFASAKKLKKQRLQLRDLVKFFGGEGGCLPYYKENYVWFKNSFYPKSKNPHQIVPQTSARMQSNGQSQWNKTKNFPQTLHTGQGRSVYWGHRQ